MAEICAIVITKRLGSNDLHNVALNPDNFMCLCFCFFTLSEFSVLLSNAKFLHVSREAGRVSVSPVL